MRRADLPSFLRCAFVPVAAGLLGLALPAQAQIFDQSDWTESAAPPPPDFDVKRLVPVAMPAYMSLQFGIDPKTITIGPDGVVRYVVVGRSARSGEGGFNAFYEGMRCATQEVKSYARSGGSGWEMVRNPEWKKIDSLRTRYDAALSDQGICRGNAPRASVSDMINHFKEPVRPVE